MAGSEWLITISCLVVGRIGKKDVVQCLSSLSNAGRVAVYLCGPNAMMSAMEQMLLESGLSRRQIRYEVWW